METIKILPVVIAFLVGYHVMFFSYGFMVKKIFDLGKKIGRRSCLREQLKNMK